MQANSLAPHLIQLCLSNQEITTRLLDEQTLFIYKAPKDELIAGH